MSESKEFIIAGIDINKIGKGKDDSDVLFSIVKPFNLALKRAPERIQTLKLLYEDSLQRALTEDGSRTSAYITPQAYYPTVS